MTDATVTILRPRTPGPEIERLARFYADMTWSGRIGPGGMGPGTPSMTAGGRGTHRRIHDGLWIVGDYRQNQYLEDGSFVLTRQLHWVTGWANEAGEYRETQNDDYRHAAVMRGHVDGDRLVYEAVGEPVVRLRLVWDQSDPTAPVWTNEASVPGGPWTLVERYRMAPATPAAG